MSVKKCVWQPITWDELHEGWKPECSPGDAYVSGGVSDLSEMKATYTYCPKCGKEIDFKIHSNN